MINKQTRLYFYMSDEIKIRMMTELLIRFLTINLA